jgi:glutamate/tyrosine decarboxylase-like PLP-dependent enzyme
MKHSALHGREGSLLLDIAAYAGRYQDGDRSLDGVAGANALRRSFDIGLPDKGRPAHDVLADLVEAAEPGIVGSTKPGFLSWVIGASHEAGVAADWLTSLWGQNAGLYQTSPAAAVCEEVVSAWLLDLLDLPRQSSIGFATGATMATFTCLAAARSEVFRRAGYDVDEHGLQGAPHVTVLIGADAHVSNRAALRYLGLGKSNIVEVEARPDGAMRVDSLRAAAADVSGPAIIVAQAGHIHSGAFDDFGAAAEVARQLGAWLHVDGAFGLWARSAPARRPLVEHLELADSWAVDGHKWLQTPYDSGFAIIRHSAAVQRAMAKEAGYLNHASDDGHNPSGLVPELSRRARGFAAWAMLQTLGRDGIAMLVEQHCVAAARLAERCQAIPGVEIPHPVVLNQVALKLSGREQEVCDRLNATGDFFLRTAKWRGDTILRVSFSGHPSGPDTADALADALTCILKD